MSESEDVRTRIIREAQKMFFSKGYSTVLMSEMARDLGISKKTMYRYFSSKEELLVAGIAYHRKQLDDEVEVILQDEHLLFPEKANQIYKVIGSRLISVSSAMLSDLKKNAPNALAQMLRENVSLSYNRFNKILAEGQRQGYIREDLNYNIACLAYIRSVETMFEPDFITHLPPEIQEVMPTKPADIFEGLLSIIMKGILK
ncbi:TetR/AcrR family transcriptional regulator [Pontibacter arcticus]|uniref:HTH tetR-type domain-containing protein n=1 Tax=Pontibacter arcticus TaxID=2080288 RepID=A0A364RCB2_9BACT|nr:TetR/AcrR family transcriptional regulator [Pontibacter arcticus]RAU81913.1 hypothetical protein DP923_14595 [Pontibacter arcticus]